MDELFPLVDEQGNTIGSASRKECHSSSMLLHPVVHLHVINSKGELFLQKRGLHKDIQPGKWDTAVGGHIDLGETTEQALRREAYEELGLTHFTPLSLGSYLFQSEVERELVYSHIALIHDAPQINQEELADGKFWSIKQIEGSLGMAEITKNFKQEYTLFREQMLGLIDKLIAQEIHN